ncbi:phospho-sugar mutase [Clostridium sediminicola]|uniref:phospho-sugar mutase n=1 Tax=Clostridium sediminicola TaxID=3114879 RepID=UPI0031F27C1D
MTYKQKYQEWLNSTLIDESTKSELKNIKDDKEIEDRFYKDLEFGTGGLRGVIGAGSNRMNVYTVGKATQGLANYLLKKYSGENISVSIACDSRNMSEEFAESAAKTLCANGIKVNLFESLRPTPELSYTVRELGSKAGIVVTASHNPKQYNGYKVYGADGGQVTDGDAKEIIGFVNDISDFDEIKSIDKEEAITQNLLNIIGEEVDKSYLDRVKSLTIRADLVAKYAKDLKIIYTPIHGSGNIPIRRVLKELGYENVSVVKEQEKPDGNFPTASYPNPEEPQVFDIALEMAEEIKPDIIFGTDPDCDRIGAVVLDNKGEHKVLTGNQMGALLTNYIMTSLNELNKMPKKPAIIKTIVTTEIVSKITEKYNAELINVLTGFKYIGEKIKQFEENKDKTFLFGFEESYGYLSGDFVRDKDAVIAAVLICEMTLYYKSIGLSLYDALINMYEEFGYYKESLVSISLEGKEGQEKIENALQCLRHSMNPTIDDVSILKKIDYKLSLEKDLEKMTESIIDLPKSNVLKFILSDGSWFVVRPSGTEPKMKIYLSVVGKNLKDAELRIDEFRDNVMEIINEAINQ